VNDLKAKISNTVPPNRTDRIPYLEFDLFVVNVHHPRSELHTNCEVMDGLKPFVGKLEEKARFT
jgi:hypothetical protein